MQRLEGEYAGTAQGVEMRYGIRTHDMAYEKARVAELEGLAAKWTAPGAGASPWPTSRRATRTGASR